jgi:hypothetical protein
VWFRVFGTNDVLPEPAALLEFIRGLEFGYEVVGKFTGDDRGWFRAELEIAYAEIPLIIERYLEEEEGIRAELNTWAAWIETAENNQNRGWLMQHLISTTQIWTLNGPTDADSVLSTEYLCLMLCKYLARETAGVYQVDNHGFCRSDGTLLVKEA